MASTAPAPSAAIVDLPNEVQAFGEPLSLSQLTWRRFRRHRMALFGSGLLLLLVLWIGFGSLIFSRGLCSGTGKYVRGEAYANCNDTAKKLQAPSREHPFGTDTIGRDILTRTIYGGQISFLVGVTSALLEVLIGVTVGALAG
ncbi:MAG: hypothetical protein HY784_03985, partial [Chloroflexi bacterium]|nr:hypothetical protein [Chloroflexota bacterium]